MAKLTIRSGIFFDTSNPKAIETVRSCLCEMNRVGELKLNTTPGLNLEKYFRDLPKSAPQLHTLCISNTSGFPFFSIDEDFLYDTERLRRVELINCKIGWDSRLLTGLTRLHLEDSLKANSSIIQFFHALQQMPALTDLHLKDSIPDSEGLTTYPVVNLPCLRVLYISSGVGALTTVLRHITIPNSAILHLTCRENRSTQIDFSNFLSVLVTKFLSSLVIQSLGLRLLNDPLLDDDNETQGLEFNLWTTPIIQDFGSSQSQRQIVIQDFESSQFQIQLVMTWPSPQPHNHVKALTCAFDAMSLPFLTQLHISTLDYIDSQIWVETFGKLPHLRRVSVQGSTSSSFLEALAYKTKAAEKSKTAHCNVSFPKLLFIDLEGTFNSRDPRSILVDMLLDCLMERCERKAAVQVLRLCCCYNTRSDDVERLKEIVVNVIWDGILIGVSKENRDSDSSSSSEEL